MKVMNFLRLYFFSYCLNLEKSFKAYMKNHKRSYDGYYVAYKPITISCILFMFNKIEFIHCHYCVIFTVKYTSIYND